MVKKVFTLGIILFITMWLSGCYTTFHVANAKVKEVSEIPVTVVIYPEPVKPIVPLPEPVIPVIPAPEPVHPVLPAPKPPTKLRKPSLSINNLNNGKLRNSAGTNSRGTHSRNGIRKNRRNSRS